jgi:hypothetical protein
MWGAWYACWDMLMGQMIHRVIGIPGELHWARTCLNGVVTDVCMCAQ